MLLGHLIHARDLLGVLPHAPPAAPPGPAAINNETAQPVLAIGADPPQRLHRWRAAGELCGCRDRDLHFSLSESRGLGYKRRSGFALT